MGTLSTRQRLEAMRAWLDAEACEGHEYKAPGRRIDEIIYRRPQVYVGYWPVRGLKGDPRRGEKVNMDFGDAAAPSILIMLSPSEARNMIAERYDQHNNIRRTQEFGGKLNLCVLFNVYEPGTRYPGFDGYKPDFIEDGSEEGVYTLTDWMDEVMHKLDGTESIPDSDLFIMHNTIQYSQYVDGNYIADRRPFFYGMLTATFGYYAVEKNTEGNFSSGLAAALDPQ